ncbi:hypothetical protein EPUL_006169 [Erysiphe pulchra]|uniref:Phosphoglycerate mutase-like protein n=1 Tax=Erysiphe pulchra TaxID=225359 RepID=A0A2S4PJI0_9PEZI|nr:hypothetical protein EPUL_006169 [Erysiphe pulchra]
MKILLIRHGETVDNVAGIYAGTLDSSLTNHGLIQADRLGQFLQRNGYRIRQIFSSDLQRAFLTARAIEKYQHDYSPSIKCLKNLREQDFGSFEGRKISSRPITSKSIDNNFIDEKNSTTRKVESKRSLDARADNFIDNYLSSLPREETENDTFAVVSHGIFLGYLWRAILKRFSSSNIFIESDLSRNLTGLNLKYIGNWSNTGYLEFDITKERSIHVNSKPEHSSVSDTLPCQDAYDAGLQHTSGQDVDSYKSNNAKPCENSKTINDSIFKCQFLHFFIEVKSINSQDHLDGLQKLRGGTGNLKYDPSQNKIDKYFQKAKKKQRTL